MKKIFLWFAKIMIFITFLSSLYFWYKSYSYVPKIDYCANELYVKFLVVKASASMIISILSGFYVSAIKEE